jgi:hypothetical protein
MPLFKVKITQVLRTQKSITLVLEANSREDIMDALDAGEYDLPSAEDPAWVTEQSRVEHEETALV